MRGIPDESVRGDYYNDFDPGAAAWLRELINGGHIPAGQVDDRSILDVAADDLAGFRRCHFFAGIAGWSEALRLAGWPDAIPVWTGSPPCQPFSAAGKRAGRNDARHLGPRFVELVRARRPPVLFGEQVASADAIGRAAKPGKRGAGSEPAWAWWDDLSLRLEAAGYAAWAAVVPAAAVGAPHIRERLFFAAVDLRFAAGGRGRDCPDAGSATRGVADADGRDASAERQQRGGQYGQQPQDGGAGGMADSRSVRRDGGQGAAPRCEYVGPDAGWPKGHDGSVGFGEAGIGSLRSGPTNGFWGSADWLLCGDERWRPVEPSPLGLADGLPGSVVPSGAFVPASYPLAKGQERRVMRLRGYGNAIVPQAAAVFVETSIEILRDAGIWLRLERDFT